jgi:phage gp45-like
MALSTINASTGLTDGTVTSVKLADFAAAVDLNGVELILDADQDTSITADTDDRIDFKIAGVEHFSFSNSSGDTIIKPMVDAKDIKFQQFDGRTLLDINDAGFVGIENGATGPGAIRIFEDTDNGSNYVGLSVGNVSTSYTLVLPTADGSSGEALTTNGSGVLSFSAVSANTPSSADGQALGSASLEWSDLFLADASTIQFGADQDVILTHVADTGLLLNSTMKLQFNDASQFIHAPSATVLDIAATDEIELNATLVDVNANLDVSGTIVGASTISGTTITATTAFVPDASDGAALGTTALEFSDLFLADASTIQFGADQDVILTHVADTGLLLSGTNVIQFNDASQNIGAPSNAILDINATDEIELNATLVDINGNVEISGTATTTGVHTFTAIPVFPNDTIETADIQADAITGAKIADDQIDSEHYVDGSIDTAHLADGQVTIGKLATAVLTGATDIGAGIADADLFLVDDGAGGTLRKTAASRLKTYIGSNAPAFCARESGQQTLSHNTHTNLTFATEEVDSDGAFASNVFTVPSGQAGKYYIFAQLNLYDAEGNLSSGILNIWKGTNATKLSSLYSVHANTDNTQNHLNISCAVIADLAESDVIGASATMTTDDAGTATSYGGDQGTRILGFKLAGV